MLAGMSKLFAFAIAIALASTGCSRDGKAACEQTYRDHLATINARRADISRALETAGSKRALPKSFPDLSPPPVFGDYRDELTNALVLTPDAAEATLVPLLQRDSAEVDNFDFGARSCWAEVVAV